MTHLPRLVVVVLLLAGCVRPASAAMIDGCAEISSFKPSPYIALAVDLQSLPQREAIRRLESWASTRRYDVQIIILCRMLFEPVPGKEFRRPLLGAPQFYGDTTMPDWPLEPITIINDIPFTIVIGYAIAGEPIDGREYLEYCLSNARWTTRHYHAVDSQQIASALEQLFASKAWKRPLNEWEMGLLKKQIE